VILIVEQSFITKARRDKVNNKNRRHVYDTTSNENNRDFTDYADFLLFHLCNPCCFHIRQHDYDTTNNENQTEISPITPIFHAV